MYALDFRADQYDALVRHLYADSTRERAAYLLCRVGTGTRSIKLIVTDVIPVSDNEVVESSQYHMQIRSESYMRAMKRASIRGECFVFVHTHPNGCRRHSEQDDREEVTLFASAYTRIQSNGPHASIVFSDPQVTSGRVWLPDGSTEPIDRIRVIGDRFRFQFFDDDDFEPAVFFDRQVRAFGRDVQRLLSRLKIGVIGAGGTGSCVAEQLIRLGVGSVVVTDGDRFDGTNVNRVYGSGVQDQDESKVSLVKRNANRIGLNTQVDIHTRPVTFASVMRELIDCEVIMGCTDDQWGRALLNRLMLYYYIPVIDMGVKIDSHEGVIRSVQGRVTTLIPGTGCLFCTGRITPEGVAAQSLRETSPNEAEGRRREGYTPELEDPAPAVIPFTSAIASAAVCDLLHRITGFMGPSTANETIYLFDVGKILRTRRDAGPNCLCGQESHWGRGDTRLLLDGIWRAE